MTVLIGRRTDRRASGRLRLIAAALVALCIASGTTQLPVGSASSARLSCGHVGTLVGFLVLGHNTIIGSTDAGNMAFSTDGGTCWTAASLDRPIEHRMGDLLVDPAHPDIVLAAGGNIGRVGIGATAGLLRSTNLGRSWQVVGTQSGLPRTYYVVTSVVAAAGSLYAAVNCPDEQLYVSIRQHPAMLCGAPVYRSSDGGAHWRPAGLGTAYVPMHKLPSRFEGSVQAMAAAGATIFAPVAPLTGNVALYRSSNAGRTWKVLAPEQRLTDTTVLISLDIKGHSLLAGVGIVSASPQLLRSDNGGSTWRQVLAVPGASDPIFVGCVHPNATILCAGLRHLYRSDDEGRSWREPGSIGMTSTNATFIGSGPDQTVYVSRVGGLFHSSDGGDHWLRS